MSDKKRSTRATPEEVQAEVDALAQPMKDYLAGVQERNLPLAHRAAQLFNEATALMVTVAQTEGAIAEPLN